MPACLRRSRSAPLAAFAFLLAVLSTDAFAQLPGLGRGGGVGGSGIGGGIPGGLPGGLSSSGPAIGAPENGLPISGMQDGIGGSLLRLPLPDVGPAVSSATGTIGSVTDPLLNGSGINRALPGGGGVPTPRSGVPPAGERRFIPNEVVLNLPTRLSSGALDELAGRHRLVRVDARPLSITGTTLHRWRISDGRPVADVIRALEAESGLGVAQPNYRFRLQQSPSPLRSDPAQYAPAKLRLAQAHQIATGERVTIGVIDSGVETGHPEIAGLVAGSFDALGSGEPPHSHGTAMASAIVAHSRLTGVAPGARILAIRAFSSSGEADEGTTLTILRGMDWAMAHGARVLNMSFAGPHDPQIARGIAAARQKGLVIVAAAGNAGAKAPPQFPANDPNVIAVTATDSQDHLLAVASRGRHIALAAPGVDILAAAPRGGYQLSSGTSIAAAHVSGIAALLIERSPNLTPAALKKTLLSSALDLGPKGRDDQFGAGLVDAYRALLALEPAAQPPAQAAVAR
ncbi:MAG: S8 family serine peptidase [Xanthobacteraceae bacterium]